MPRLIKIQLKNGSTLKYECNKVESIEIQGLGAVDLKIQGNGMVLYDRIKSKTKGLLNNFRLNNFSVGSDEET